MSNRQERKIRRTYIPDSESVLGGHLIESGITVEITGNQVTKAFERDPLEGLGPNDHLWAIIAMYRVNPDEMPKGQVHLDMESLVNLSGPGCYKCEQVYTPELAAKSCPGMIP